MTEPQSATERTFTVEKFLLIHQTVPVAAYLNGLAGDRQDRAEIFRESTAALDKGGKLF